MNDFLYGLLPEQLLLALLLLLMILEIFGRGRRLAGLLFVLVTGIGCLVLLQQFSDGYTKILLPDELVVDRFALLARLVVLGCGLIYGLCQLSERDGFKFWLLISSSLLGAMLLFVSAGFVSLFLGIEILSLPGFALMVYRRSSADAAEGAFKYLLLSAVASALILFGLSLGYGSTGSLSIASFSASLAAKGPLSLTAGSLVCCGFFLKAAVFPFHGWAPDAYAGAKLQVTTLLASVTKGAVVLGLVRILGNTAITAEMTELILVLAVISIFYGNITAVRQPTFRRMLAYSSIAHAGYMVFAFADSTGSRIDDLLYYVAVYALTVIVASSCFAMLVPGEDDKLECLEGGFAARPLSSLLLTLAVLSLAGIPPLPGFFAKLFIFKAVIASGHLLPAVLAFTGSFLGATYYLAIVYRLFKTRVPQPVQEIASQASWRWGGVLLGSLLLVVMIVPAAFGLL